MAEELQIEKDLVEDLLSRLSGKGKKGREAAIEALAVSTEDDDWRPDELIKQGGIEIIRDLLGDKNQHIVLSALEIIIAIAARTSLKLSLIPSFISLTIPSRPPPRLNETDSDGCASMYSCISFAYSSMLALSLYGKNGDIAAWV